MQKIIILTCFVLLALLFSAYIFFRIFEKDDLSFNGYNLNKPASIHTLPPSLLEISGISYIGDNRIAAEQDESGTIFIYDLLSRRVVDTLSYAETGDYEDIAYTGEGVYYVLKSDGTLIEYDALAKTVNRYVLSTGAKNNEGLAYDPVTNSLLVTTKSKAGKGKSFKDERYIYVFDLQQKTLKDDPFFVINIKDIEAYFNGSVSELKFRPSAIAVHPITRHIFVVSATDHVISIFDRSGNILEVLKLDEKLFYKPEGMTFTHTNNLLIANEGDTDVSAKMIEFFYTP